MNQVPPYEFTLYLRFSRIGILGLTGLELLLLLLTGSLDNSNVIGKLIIFISLIASVAVTAYNLFLNVDPRIEMLKVLSAYNNNETRGFSAILVFTPLVAAILTFLSAPDSGIFSFFAFFGIVVAGGNMAIISYEHVQGTSSNENFTKPKDCRKRVAAMDPNYQTLAHVSDQFGQGEKSENQ